MLQRVAVAIGMAGGLCSIAATLLVLIVPLYTTASIQVGSNAPADIRRETLLQVGLEPRAMIFLGGMALVGGFGLVAVNSIRKSENRPLARAALWFSALVAAAGCAVSLWTVGIFYAPAALLLLLSAVLTTLGDGLAFLRGHAPKSAE